MNWYRFAKDYVTPIIDQNAQIVQQTNFSPGLENAITDNRNLNNKKNEFIPLDTFLALNSSPNTMKANGAGSEYNLKEHEDLNMPEGGDNFIDATNWNS